MFYQIYLVSLGLINEEEMYFYNKKSHLDQLSKFPDMMSLGELQISFPLFFVPKIHLITSYLELI